MQFAIPVRLLLSVLVALPLVSANPLLAKRPRLIVQISVDQLRGDVPWLYADRYGRSGYRYLMNKGIWYRNATHPHSHTETVVGHTTLATGACPSAHGMVGNKWFDRATGVAQNNVADSGTTLLPVAKDGDGKDLTGSSPNNIWVSTFSDELFLATGGQAKIFAVAGKDRAAIPLAGHYGKAFWFVANTGKFATSTHYYKDEASLPRWATEFNSSGAVDRHRDQKWELSRPLDTYVWKAWVENQ